MLKIQSCNISFRNKVHPSDHSSITINRVKKILSEKFRVLDGLEGKVHLKNVRLDLGSISPTDFQLDFYQRLSEGCQQLVEKLSIEHVSAGTKAIKTKQKSSTKDKLQNNKQEFERLKKFVAELQFLPKESELEELERAYYSVFKAHLSNTSKALLFALINPKRAVGKKSSKNDDSTDAFEALQYILELLDTSNPNKNWMEKAMKDYKSRKGEEMSKHLQGLLRNALNDDSREIEISDKDHIQELQQVNEIKYLEPSIHEFIFNWFSKNTLSDNCIDNLSRDFEQQRQLILPPWVLTLLKDSFTTHIQEQNQLKRNQFKETIAEKLSDHTKNDHQLVVSTEAFVLHWISTKSLTGNWLHDLSSAFEQQKGEVLPPWIFTLLQDAFATEMLTLDEQNREKLLKKLTKTLADKLEINEANEINEQESIKPLHEAYIFEWLSTNKLTGDWLHNLHRAFGEQQGFPIPGWLNTLLQNTFAESTSEQEIRNRYQFIETITNNQSIGPLMDETISHKIEISVKTFILEWLSEHPINENWLNKLSVDFERSKGRKMEDWLLKLLKKMDAYIVINPDVILHDLFIEWVSRDRSVELFESRKNIEKRNEWDQVDRSVQEYILSWIKEHELTGNWLRELSADFEVQQGEEFPRYLQTFLKLTYSSIQELESNFYEHFIESLSNQIKTHSLQNQKENSESSGKAASKEAFKNDVIKEFATHNRALDPFISMREFRRFLLEWIEQKGLITNWVQLFKSDYQEKYKQPFSDSTITLLEKLEATFNEDLVAERQTISNSIMIEAVTHNFIFKWLTEHELNESWIEQLTSDYQDESGAVFPMWLQQFIENSFNELSTLLNVSVLNEQFISAFSRAMEEKRTGESIKGLIDQPATVNSNNPVLVFIMDWIGKHVLNSNWQYQLSIAFKKKFEKKLSKQWQDLIRDAFGAIDKKLDKSLRKKQLLHKLPALFNEQDKTSERKSAPIPPENQVLDDASHLFILNWISNQTLNENSLVQFKLDYQEKLGVEVPEWLINLLEKTHTTVRQLGRKIPNRETLINVLSDQLSAEESESVNTVNSLANYQYVREANNFIIEKMKNFNDGKPSKKIIEWIQWISIIEGSRRFADWLELLKKRHLQEYKAELSMSDQLIFLELCLDETSRQEINQQDDWIVNLKVQLKSYLRIMERRGSSLEIMKSPMEFYQLVKKISFDNNWFDKVKQLYVRQYNTSMPKTLQKLFFKLRKKKFESEGDAGRFDDSFTAINIDKSELQTYLSGYLNTQELGFLTKAIASITKTKSTLWLEELLQSFQILSGRGLPLEAQIALAHFGSLEQRWTPFMLEEKIKGVISNQLNLNIVDDIEKSDIPSRLEVFQFFKKQLSEIQTTSDWLDEFMLRYKHTFKNPLSETYKEWINEQLNKETLSGKKSAPVSNQLLASAFIKYIDENAMQDKAKDLIKLFNALPEQHEDAWFGLIMSSYKKLRGVAMPLELQTILLEFTKKNNTLIHSDHHKEEILETRDLLSIALDDEIDRIALEKMKWSKEQLSKLYDWMEARSWASMKYNVVKNDYEEYFGTLMPEWIKQILMRYVESNKLKSSNSKALVTAESNNISQPLKKIPKKVSDRAKLLKLRKQLENMSDEKNIPDAEIIQDAGIIVGWIFWKKCFDRFGWLQDGKFYNKDGMYSGILAANWLTRLGSYYVDCINPFMITICDLLVDECTYLSDTELELHLEGATLKASIDDYYINLMGMWPIFEADQKAEFKELFIQREGVLTSTFFGWNLAIVKEPYDALMAKNPIPWPLSVIRFPWTGTTIDIEW